MRKIYAFLAVLTVILAAVVTVVGIQAKPMLLSAPEEASARVERLLSAVSAGDYGDVSACLLGNPALGVDRAPENAVGSLVWSAFTRSFRYTLVGDFYASSDGLSREISVEYLDIGSVTNGLNARTLELVNQRVQEAQYSSEVYDENNEIREEVLMEIVAQVVSEALAQRAQTVTAQLTLNLVHQDGAWWIVADNALLSAISGNTL